jgi:MFS family permease
MVLALTAATFGTGVSTVGIQMLTPPHLRAQATALYLLVANSIGLTAGPALVPLLTDHVYHNPNAINWAIAEVSAVASAIALVGFMLCRAPFAATARRQVELFG